MNIVPDVLPYLNPTVDVTLSFRKRAINPGEFVESVLSKHLPTLNIQVFDKGPRPVTIVVVDPDVPNVEKDSFDYRCHFIATNVVIDPTSPKVSLARINQGPNIVLPWLPPYAQKGSPYHRLVTFVLEHPEGKELDVQKLMDRYKNGGNKFNMRAFNDRYGLKPVGVHLFRTVWDNGMYQVMKDLGVQEADMMLKRKLPEKLPEYLSRRDTARFR